MYQSYYGFTEMPFHITPDPKFLYLSTTHQEALQHLKYGVGEKKGFIVLIGEVGPTEDDKHVRRARVVRPDELDDQPAADHAQPHAGAGVDHAGLQGKQAGGLGRGVHGGPFVNEAPLCGFPVARDRTGIPIILSISITLFNIIFTSLLSVPK